MQFAFLICVRTAKTKSLLTVVFYSSLPRRAVLFQLPRFTLFFNFIIKMIPGLASFSCEINSMDIFSDNKLSGLERAVCVIVVFSEDPSKLQAFLGPLNDGVGTFGMRLNHPRSNI